MATFANISILRLSIVIFLCDYATSLIIPEELPTILSLIYSNIPPIKKGTDSRLGVGFRLGEHADFQILFELGPQTDTDPIGTNESKKRRDAMYMAAMKGELGPLAQAIAKYQTERKIYEELEKLKKLEDKMKNVEVQNTEDNKNDTSSDWLMNWSKEMSKSSGTQVPLKRVSNEEISLNTNGSSQSHQKTQSTAGGKEKLEELKKLYKSVDNKT
ncbi:hypothetical protein HZH66_007096 [Vespula vulgaris]|uniref:Uncharacterized protein n=2 Tax=Vespula TaxID=7451 RepID=A0A834JWX7_VESVU|nr:uncharacterized protein LOC127065390 [Vespula vulgaris]XP_050853624.1 uncharacterized protein LOC127065390 [Vespula vulgaris]XP_050853626.1 uncharacterized protein LOC127065390 [Vespula vulgaris]XP_050853627.1 uncharacterized protein LOC127065390 [Vespula vulgaris]KAF7396234.1 hypothetical protein HZH66_007096 [Vespula vulgaris]